MPKMDLMTSDVGAGTSRPETSAERRVSVHGVEVHADTAVLGLGHDPARAEGAVKVPLYQTSTFCFPTAADGKRHFETAHGMRSLDDGATQGMIYSRLDNPDVDILEQRLCTWDGAEQAAAFDSGMAAIATTLLTLARPGDVILHSDPLYGGTDHLLRSLLPQFDIREVGFGAGAAGGERPDAEREIAELIERHGASKVAAVYVETPGNPTNALTDLAAVRRGIDRACGPDPDRRIPLVVDNTFLGPMWQRPLDHGADLVVYSATKYLGGHSDLIAGAVLGDAELIGRIRGTRLVLGTIASPYTAWLLLRSLETLRIRTRAQEENARIVADHLAAHPKVARVAYLGHLSPGDPDHEIYERQCLGPGAMISIWLTDDGGSASGESSDASTGDVACREEREEATAFRFLDALRVFRLAVSLGSTESLAQHPATMTHVGVPVDERRRLDITPALVRLSVGIEHPDDLLADLDRALAAT